MQSMQGDSVVLEIPSDTQPVGLDEASPSLILTRELKQQTFLIHGRVPEVKFQASHLLRMPSRF